MIFEHTLDELVQQVWGKELMNVSSWKSMGKGLR